MERNSDRFFNASTSLSRKLRYGTAKDRSDPGSNTNTSESAVDEEKSRESRTAVVVRAHTELNFGPDTVLHLRSLIAELSLHSGGEYVVFLLVQVKDGSKPDLEDAIVYQETLNKYIPRELHSMTILFEQQSLMTTWYPPLAEDDLTFMNQALLLFAELHPEFETFWHMELDIRYTGHWYNLLKNADSVRKPFSIQSSSFHPSLPHTRHRDFLPLLTYPTLLLTPRSSQQEKSLTAKYHSGRAPNLANSNGSAQAASTSPPSTTPGRTSPPPSKPPALPPAASGVHPTTSPSPRLPVRRPLSPTHPRTPTPGASAKPPTSSTPAPSSAGPRAGASPTTSPAIRTARSKCAPPSNSPSCAIPDACCTSCTPSKSNTACR